MGDANRRKAKGPEAESQETVGAAPPSFEGALEQLESTVARLEDGELPLEEALELFERGVGLSRQCATTLESAERRIEVLVASRDADGDSWVREPFETDDDVEEDDEDFED